MGLEKLNPESPSGATFNPLNILGMFSGFKTYIAGVGLIALGVYQMTQGDYQTGMQTIAAGLAVFGVGHKLEKASESK